MTDELSALCALTGEVLFGYQKYEQKDSLDWEKICELSRKQTVSSTVVYAAPQGIPKDLQKAWISSVCQMERNNYRLYLGNQALHQLLTEHQIPYVIIKGYASAGYYRNEYFRVQGDIDFLVPCDMAEETDALLQAQGYKKETSLDYEIGYKKDGLTYELHMDVNGIPEGEKGQIVREYLSDAISTAHLSGKSDHVFMVPDEFHHGLIILLHTARHLVGFGIGLRQISDWAVFANSLGERFPDVFETALKECGLWDFARALTQVCIVYLHMPPLSWAQGFSSDFLEKFADDLLRKGSLHHDGSDDMDSLLIEKANLGGISDEPMLLRLIKNIGEKAQFRWPYMKKVKVLIPFGVLIMCIQYAFGSITGKYQKIHVLKMKSNAERRRDLYKELKLFE